MRLFHRHKWKIEEKPIEVDRPDWPGHGWYTTIEIARIDRCECGRVRGWLISARHWEQASVPWLREMMKGGQAHMSDEDETFYSAAMKKIAELEAAAQAVVDMPTGESFGYNLVGQQKIEALWAVLRSKG